MTSTFLGKWRLSFQWSTEYDNYVLYRPQGDSDLTVLHVYTGPPRPETNIAFIRTADATLCFQFNNGKSVNNSSAFFLSRTHSNSRQPFRFQARDKPILRLRSRAKSRLWGPTGSLTPITGMVLAASSSSGDVVFAISQITPSLASVQNKGNGDGFDFGWVDLTGATLNKVSLVGSDFSHCNLTNFKFLDCVMKRTILNNCILPGADFSGSVLAGAQLNGVDLVGVLANAPLPEFSTRPLQPPSPDNPRTSFVGSRLKQSLIDSDWSMLDLTGATISDLSSPLSSQARPLTARYSVLTTLNHNDLSDLSLQYAAFDYAVLDLVNLDGADLRNASFIQARPCTEPCCRTPLSRTPS